MAYLGNDPSYANLNANKYSYIATESQTIFNAVYDNVVDVYLNGMKLQDGVDYTATNGVTVVLTVAATEDDVVDIAGYFNIENFNIENYIETELDITLSGDVSGTANVDITESGTVSITATVAQTLTNKTLGVSSYTQIADASLGAGTHTFDYSAGDMQQLTATGDITITFSNFVTGKVCTMIIDAVNWGDYTITHPAAMLFTAGTAPTYTAGGTDRLMIVKDKDDIYSLFIIGQTVGVVA